MRPVLSIVSTLVYVYSLLIFGRLILSWFPLHPGTASYRVYSFLYDVTEPYLKPFRRVVPPIRSGNAAIDLSALVGLVVLYIVQLVLARL